MTRAQWLFLCITATVAVVAYIRADQLARRLNSGQYQKPNAWTA